MPDRPRIGVWITRTDPYWVQVSAAIHLHGQQLPVDLIPLEATMEFSGQPEADQDKLAEDILSFGLSALVITYIPQQAALQILNAGLPLVQLTEAEFDHPNLVSFEGFYDCAFQAGQFVAERLNGKGRILVIGGLWVKDGEGGNSRIEAIAEVIKKFPELTWQHIPTPWAYEKAYPVIEKALKTTPGPINAIVGISDTLALAACNAGHTLGLVTPQTIIVGINGDPLALAAVAEGNMTATFETDTANLGREAMDVAYDLALGKRTRRSLSSHPFLVTAKNVGELALKKLISIADIPSRLVGTNLQAEQFRIKQLEMVTSINQQVGGLLDRQKLLHEVAGLICKNYHYSQVYVYCWHDPGRVLRREYPQPVRGGDIQIPIEQAGLIGKVALKGESIFIPDSLHSLIYMPDPAYPHTCSRTILPIRYNQKVVGALDLHSSRRVQHLRHELLGLQLLADQIGIAEQNASLFEQAVAARAAAEKTDQLKTRLLANVSHELRAPLNTILGYSQSAMAIPNPYGVDLPLELRQDFQHIINSGKHLSRLINDLLDMSRLEIDALDLFPEIIEMRTFLEETFQVIAKGTSKKNINWQTEFPDRLPVIEADPVRLRQILLNLLSNASKFTEQGTICLGAEVEPPYLHLWVQDTGIGIPPEYQERIFEPFVTSEHMGRRGEGVGLGLSITSKLVALHGGSMTLESQSDHGSTFHVYLPLPNLLGQPGLIPVLTKEPVVLLLSHHAEPSHTVLQLCQRKGMELHKVNFIEETLAYLNMHQPALLVWDMEDASVQDWSIMQRLRQIPQICSLPFILYSQKPDAAPSGLTNIILKPVARTTLMELIEAFRPVEKGGPLLVVDDDPEARKLYQRFLGEAYPGYSILSAEDGQIALDILAQVVPDLVILDLMLPRVDGFTVLEKMRNDKRLRNIPVIVLSGKLLVLKDVERLNYDRVVFFSKDLLSPDEIVKAFQCATETPDRLSRPTSEVVKRVLVYMHENYSNVLTRKEIALAVGVSESYLSEIFHQEMGISLWECLNRFRLHQAKELLMTTSLSVTEIADQVGFEDPSYFSRVFTQYNGLSPTKYRNQELNS